MSMALSPYEGDRRENLQREVEFILASAKDGRITENSENQLIDFKEEAERRRGSYVEPGSVENPGAATKIADEVACMANSPQGGALILGVEDGTGTIIGTELGVDWLRHRVNNAVDVAPDIVERHVEGQRLLVIYVAPAAEPVTDTSGRIRWRVGDSCQPVDRAEWWEYRRRQRTYDEMAQSTSRTLAHVRSGAMVIVAHSSPAVDDLTVEETLRRLGALSPSGTLTYAGALLFTAQPASVIDLTVFDVFGGYITNQVTGEPGTSALEQLDLIERSLKVVNKNTTLIEGFVHMSIPQIPHNAVREALLNAMIHRDWNRSEPIDVRWIDLDSTLIVRSPGGFPTSITSNNVLSNRAARYPALADLYRAIGLVDKQGVGVDRMYQSMITLGHRPPTIEQVAGPYIETTLSGGPPVPSVVELTSKIVPEPRQRDYRIAIIVYQLLSRAYVTEETVAHGLQSGVQEARNALEAGVQTSVGGQPLIEAYRSVWRFGAPARRILDDAGQLPYSSTDVGDMVQVALMWLREVGDLATADIVELCGVSRGTANKCIESMLEDRTIAKVGGGRSTRYRLRSRR